MKSIAIAAAVFLCTAQNCVAQNLPAWQRAHGDDDIGAAAIVEMHRLVDNQPAGAYFGYRCYYDKDKFGWDSVAYFVKLDNRGMACMKDPVSNVSIAIDGKSYPHVFTCSDIGGGTIYMEWGMDSRADSRNRYELEQAFDRAKIKEFVLSVTDTKHYIFRGSLANVSSLRKSVDKICFSNRK